MLLDERPLKAADIAKESQREFPATMMHLLGLVRMGYVESPQKGVYALTGKGKQALGVQETTKEKAADILNYAPHDKAFHFYTGMGKPLSMHAHSLRDFANKIEKVEAASVEFHIKRGDFEAWFKGLGDDELAKKTALLKARNIAGEKMRRQLQEIVEQRYLELAKLSGQPLPTE